MDYELFIPPSNQLDEGLTGVLRYGFAKSDSVRFVLLPAK